MSEDYSWRVTAPQWPDDSTGFIEDIGVPNNQLGTAAVGMCLAKSGRITGLTCGDVTSINTNVSVQYQQGCNQGKKFK